MVCLRAGKADPSYPMKEVIRVRMLIAKLKLRGSVPAERPKGLCIENERRGQFSRCQCGNCRCA